VVNAVKVYQSRFSFVPKITLLIVITLCSSIVCAEEAVEFENKFLQGSHFGNVNVDLYTKGNPILPGEYGVAVYLNDKEKFDSIKIIFIDNQTNWAAPCITREILEQLDLSADALEAVKTLTFDPERNKNLKDSQCFDLEGSFQGTTVHYDSLSLRLDITVPQVFLQERPKDYVSPARWDQGVPALLLSYDASVYHSSNATGNSDTAYGGLMYGANLGGWRMRGRGALNWDKTQGGLSYSSQDAYLQHDIAALRSQFVAGDSSTNGDIFDSWTVRGVRLHDDRQMLPNSVSGYSPVVRGVARTHAKVTVKQNGYTIYQTTVSPGAFALTDVVPGGYGNDLDVTVEESDGEKSDFVVPYSSIAQLIRPRYGRWEIAAGQLHSTALMSPPNVFMATGAYGLTNYVTTYAGIQQTDTKYTAGLVGLGLNTPLGAIAADVTQSRAQFEQRNTDTLTGQSYRLTYTSEIQSTSTNLTMAAYRFSTQHYLSLQDAAQMRDDLQRGELSDSANYQRLKNQLQLNISQPLRWNDKDHGSFYITGTWNRYWGNYNAQRLYSAGYSNAFRWLSYSVSLQRTRDQDGNEDNSIYANIIIPLSALTGDGHNPGGFSMLSSGLSTDLAGNVQTNTSASGASSDGRYGYSINTSAGSDNGARNEQIGASGSLHDSYGSFDASASHANTGDTQLSFGASGGVVIHSGGMAFTPESISEDEPLAIISAPGAEGAKVGAGQVNHAGYALSSYLTAYHENEVGLDIGSMKNDVDVKNTNSKVVPTSGAVVRVDFETDQQRAYLLTLQRSDNSFIPLGAEVFDEAGRSVGDVGQGGYAYVRGIPEHGMLRVSWGKNSDETCLIHYAIPAKLEIQGKTAMLPQLICTMAASAGTKTQAGNVVQEKTHVEE